MWINKPALILIVLIALMPLGSNAHPGRTASDGCHYCRTRCDYWGVPWNERHCHGGTPTPVPPTNPPTPRVAPPTNELNIASAIVTEVIDGDTVRVRLSDGTIEKIRIIGMDTPESKDPRKPVECFAHEATEHLRALLQSVGDSASLTRDVISGNRDTYQRLLRHIYIEPSGKAAIDIAERMIRDGYAYAYTKYPFEQGKMERYVQTQKEARENGRGLWAPGVCESDPRVATTRPPENSGSNIGDTAGSPDRLKPTEQPRWIATDSSIWGKLGVGLATAFALGIGVYLIRTRTK